MNRDSIASKIISIVKALSGNEEDFPLTRTFLELGLDSLKTMDLVLTLEDSFAIEIPDHLLTREHLSTPASVIKMIESLTSLPR